MTDIYDIWFSICLGLFIGGIIFSIISVFLANMEAKALGQEIDTEVDIDAEVDVDVDIDAEIDVDVDVDVEYEIGAELDGIESDIDVDVDLDAEVDVDIDTDIDIDSEAIGITTTPAPIMLLLSAFLLVFGISGISLYYIITIEGLKFLMFIGSPGFGFLTAKYLNVAWKKIAKSQFYKISSTQNLVGKMGEVILGVDNRGGVIKIESSTPMKFEKLHVVPFNLESNFERGTRVYIIGVRENKIVVDSNKNLIKNKIRRVVAQNIG